MTDTAAGIKIVTGNVTRGRIYDAWLFPADLVELGGISLPEFARLYGLAKSTCHKFAHEGRIHGAARLLLSRQWVVFPPAQIAPKSSSKPRKPRQQAQPRAVVRRISSSVCAPVVVDGSALGGLWRSPALGGSAAFAVDFGTSPHGLSAGSSRAGQETRGTGAPQSLVDGFCREPRMAVGQTDKPSSLQLAARTHAQRGADGQRHGGDDKDAFPASSSRVGLSGLVEGGRVSSTAADRPAACSLPNGRQL